MGEPEIFGEGERVRSSGGVFFFFDANALSHDVSTPGFLRCAAATHERAVGMRWRRVCANSHVALVRVDPVEQSLRSHPFHGQTTLQQQNRSGQQNRSAPRRQQSVKGKHRRSREVEPTSIKPQRASKLLPLGLQRLYFTRIFMVMCRFEHERFLGSDSLCHIFWS